MNFPEWKVIEMHVPLFTSSSRTHTVLLLCKDAILKGINNLLAIFSAGSKAVGYPARLDSVYKGQVKFLPGRILYLDRLLNMEFCYRSQGCLHGSEQILRPVVAFECLFFFYISAVIG